MDCLEVDKESIVDWFEVDRDFGKKMRKQGIVIFEVREDEILK